MIPPCPLCRQDTQALFLLEHRVYECKGCRLHFLSPYYTADELASLYDREYFAEREAYYAARSEAELRAPSERHLKDFCFGLDLLEGYRFGPRLLDIGCATGDFVRLAQLRGWEARGVDISPHAVAIAQNRGLPVVQGTVDHPELQNQSFDAITMWDTVEHLREPVVALKKVRRLLKRNGILLIDTPNVDCLLRRVAGALFRLTGGKFQYPVRKLYHRYHPFYYSAPALRTLLAAGGMSERQLFYKGIHALKGRKTALEELIVEGFNWLDSLMGSGYEIVSLSSPSEDRSQ